MVVVRGNKLFNVSASVLQEKSSEDRWWWCLQNSVNVFNATELMYKFYVYKMYNFKL